MFAVTLLLYRLGFLFLIARTCCSQVASTVTTFVNTASCLPTYSLGSNYPSTHSESPNSRTSSGVDPNGGRNGNPSGTPSGSLNGSPSGNSPSSPAPSSPSSSSPITGGNNRFLIVVNVGSPTKNRRVKRDRPIQAFLKSDGEAVSNCLASSSYSLSDAGILSPGGSAVYAVKSTVDYGPLVATTTIESIYAVWVVRGAVLRWENGLFRNGVASFCYDSGNIIGYYKIAPPVDCVPVQFTVASLSVCPGHGGGSSNPSTAPSYTGTGASNGFIPTVGPSGLPFPSPTGNYSFQGTSPTLPYPFPNSTVPNASGTGISASGVSGLVCGPTATSRTTTSVYGLSHTTFTRTGANCVATISITDPNTADKTNPEQYGLVYNAYVNPRIGSQPPTTNPTIFANGIPRWRSEAKDLKLISCGVAPNLTWSTQPYLNGSLGSLGALPGQAAVIDLPYVTIVYHGYLLAPETGDYTFTAAADDFAYVWLGQYAYSRWDASNAVAKTGGSSSRTRWNKGEKVPITVLYANAGSNGNSTFSLKLPNGTTTSDFSKLFLQPSASGDNFAPAPISAGSCPKLSNVSDPYCGTPYRNFYYGSGYYLKLEMLGTLGSGPGQNYNAETFDDRRVGGIGPCMSTYTCANFTIANGGKWFALTHLWSQNKWYCQSFNVSNYSGDWFSIKSKDIPRGLGYTLK